MAAVIILSVAVVVVGAIFMRSCNSGRRASAVRLFRRRLAAATISAGFAMTSEILAQEARPPVTYEQACGVADPRYRATACTVTATATSVGTTPVKITLIHPLQGAQRLRAELPADIKPDADVRFSVDAKPLASAGHLGCQAACIVEHELTPEQYARLERGRTLSVQAERPSGEALFVTVDLLQMTLGLNDAAAAALRAKQQRRPGSSLPRIRDDTLDPKYWPQGSPTGRR